MTMETVDAVIIGGGIAGALVAEQLVKAGKSVVILEAGADETGATANGWEAYLAHFQSNPIKTPNSPYPANPAAASPSVLEVGAPATASYFYQRGPNPFRSNYTRALGGTTLHWLGTSLRFTPNCFRMRSVYGQGVDWPIGYDDLAPWYERAEWTIGIAGNVDDQRFHGIHFPDGYAFPMQRIPSSYLDEWLAERTNDKVYREGDEDIPLTVTNTPAGRNSTPFAGGATVAGEARDTWLPRGGSSALAWRGQRCEGNSSCIPICPVQAKYSALKTLGTTLRTNPGTLSIRTQSVATRLETDENGYITGVVYKRYDGPHSRSFTQRRIEGRIVVMAANAIENAKLGLASNLRDASGQLGCNLMDHPFLLSWGLAPDPVGSFRGPGATSGFEMFRDGAFRRHRSGFRGEIGNWGWNLPAGAPFADVTRLARTEGLRGTALRAAVAEQLPRQVRFGAVTEQLPLPENRVTIDPSIVGALGEPRPIIDYRIDEYTFRGLTLARDVFACAFKAAGIENRTVFNEADPGWVEYNGEGLAYYGSGHLVGTHRIGANERDGVTDSYGKAFGHPNLWMVGAGAMPTIGTCNPTLTLSALTLRAAANMIETSGSL